MNKWNPWRVSTTKVVATAISWCEQKHTIENMRQWLQAHALPAPPTDYLHHYTSRVGLGHNESLVRMIAGEVFYFSNPMHFNDPLDLLPRIVAEKPADSDGVMVIAGLPSGLRARPCQRASRFSRKPSENSRKLRSRGEESSEGFLHIRIT